MSYMPRQVLISAVWVFAFVFSANVAALDDLVFNDGFDRSIGFVTVRVPDRADGVACSASANPSAQIDRVYLAQTHLLEPSHPFFVLSANRATVLKVNVIGNGASPQVSVTAQRDATVLGTLCLSGPTTLPASIDPNSQTRSNSFSVTLPSAWMKPGLSLSVRAGTATRTLDAATLKIGPEPVLNLIAQDVLLFGNTVPTANPADWNDYLATLAISSLNVTSLAPLITDRLPISMRTDGRDRFGQPAPQAATIATRNPSCTAPEATAGTCTIYAGFAVLGGVRSVVGAFMAANGLDRIAQTYGGLGQGNGVGGGLAGGSVGAGDDYGLTFNHENGHSADMPHWGSSWYGRVDGANAQKHPYAGQYGTTAEPSGGGFGNSWAYHGPSNSFVSPICAATGKERQEPMQRNGSACMVAGGKYDYFSDYSALFMFRYFAGATGVYSGVIPYPRDPLGNAAATPFSMPAKGGKVFITQPNSPHPALKKWDEALHDYVPVTVQTAGADLMRHAYPERYNVPVATFWGAYSHATPAASIIGKPQHYVGYLKKNWNPQDPTDFADIKSWVSGDAFWWGADLVLRVDYSDGSFRQAVVKKYVRATDPMDGASYAVWAVNFPDDKVATGARLYYRPMEVRYPGNATPQNINATGNTTTAANYLSGAPIVATWVP